MRFLELEELTRFERARIISARALQIAMGAPMLLEEEGGGDPIEIARKEFEADVIPFTVRSRKPLSLE